VGLVGGEVGDRPVQGRQLRIVALRDFDSGPLGHHDDQVEKVD
jgi:hypothetical protein